MSKRPAISLRMKIDALLFWANTQDNILCPLCPEIIAPGEAIDWDHAIPLALGGEHHYTNIRPLHRACHHRKTFGTKATSAGSDIHKVAKCRRIERTAKFVVKKRDQSTVGKLSRRPEVCAGSLVIKGTRIPVRSIKAFAADGYTVPEIKREYPTLFDADIRAAINYRKPKRKWPSRPIPVRSFQRSPK